MYDDDESEFFDTNKTDPLLPDKQKIVTLIYNSFTEFDKPMPTCADFYRRGKIIGEGAFGKVIIGQHKLTSQFVAIKCLPKSQLQDESVK